MPSKPSPLVWVLAVGMLGLTAYSFALSPVTMFPMPDLARIIVFHLPCAFATVVFAVYSAIAGAIYLVKRSEGWAFRTHAGMELAATMGAATMVTGILFSRVQWNAWWSWDPKQTAFLVVLLLQGAYYALRSAFTDDVLRDRASAVYATMTVLPILFLVFVFPNLPQVAKVSLHPQGVVTGGRFSPDYYTAILGVFVLLLWLCAWIFKLHVRTSQLERNKAYGTLETDRSPAAPHRVGPSVSPRETD